jgi:hypothetical protein
VLCLFGAGHRGLVNNGKVSPLFNVSGV